MPSLIDVVTGESVPFSSDDLRTQLASGNYRADPNQQYTVKTSTGATINVGGDALEGVFAESSRLETSAENVGRLEQEARKKYYDTFGNEVLSGLESFADTATLGASTLAATKLGLTTPKHIKGRREFAPIGSTIGTVGGYVLPILASGGTAAPGLVARAGGRSLTRRILEHTPAGLVGKLGRGTYGLKGAGAGKLSRMGYGTGAATLEGAIFGAGDYVSEVALENKELSAEGLVGSIGRGAMWGGAAGGIFEGASIVAGALARQGKRGLSKLRGKTDDLASGGAGATDDAAAGTTAATDDVAGAGSRHRTGFDEGAETIIPKAPKVRKELHSTEDIIPKKRRSPRNEKKNRANFEQEMIRQVDAGEDLIGKANSIFREVHEEGLASNIIRKKVDLEKSREAAMRWMDDVMTFAGSKRPFRGDPDIPIKRDWKGRSYQHRSQAKIAPPVRSRVDRIEKAQKRTEDFLDEIIGEGIDYDPITGEVIDDIADAATKHSDDAIRDIAKYEKAQYKLAEELKPHLSPEDAARLDEVTKPYKDAVDAHAAASGGKGPQGKLSRLADFAANVEVLQSLGVPLPDADALPVVGPLLGAYLKWRALSRVMGGRKFAASAASRVAAGSTTTQNKISAKIDQMLNYGTKTGSKVSKKVRPLAGPAGLLAASFTGSDGDVPPMVHKELAKGEGRQYQMRIEELRRAVENPESIRAAVGQHTQLTDPAMLEAINQVVKRQFKHLYDKAPKDERAPDILGQRRPFVPSRAKMHEWAKRIRTAEDPSTVLDDAMAGRLSLAQVDTLKTVYPQMYQEIQMEILDKAAELGSSLTFHIRVQLSTLFGVPVHSAMRPEFILAMQEGFKQQAKPPSPPPSTGGVIQLSAAETPGINRGLMR